MIVAEEITTILHSPEDVREERKAAIDILEKRFSIMEDEVFFHIIEWNTDQLPEIGWCSLLETEVKPQNREIDDICWEFGLFVGILWNRFGSPTIRADWVKKDFMRAISAFKRYDKPKVLFFFKQQSSDPPTAEERRQQRKVQQFRERLSPRGLVVDYLDILDFRAKFYQQVQEWLPDRFNKRSRGRSIDIFPSSLFNVEETDDNK